MSDHQQTTLLPGDGPERKKPSENLDKRKKRKVWVILAIFLSSLGIGYAVYRAFAEYETTAFDIEDDETHNGYQEVPDPVAPQKDTESNTQNSPDPGQDDLPTEPEPKPKPKPEPSPYDKLMDSDIELPGSKVLSETPVQVSNNRNVELIYDFEDGKSKKGVQVEHSYKDLGPKTIKVFVPEKDEPVKEKEIVVHCSKTTGEKAFNKLYNFARAPSNDPDGKKWDAAMVELEKLCYSPQTQVVVEGVSNTCEGGCDFTRFKSSARVIRAAMRRGSQPRIVQNLMTESGSGKITRVVIKI